MKGRPRSGRNSISLGKNETNEDEDYDSDDLVYCSTCMEKGCSMSEHGTLYHIGFYKEKIKQLEAENEELNRELANIPEDKDQYVRYVNKIEAENQRLEEAILDLKKQLIDRCFESELSTTVANQMITIQKLREAIEKHIKNMDEIRSDLKTIALIEANTLVLHKALEE